MPIEQTGWTFAYILPKRKITAPSELIRDLIGGMTESVIKNTGERIVMNMGILAALMLVVLVLTSFVAANVSRRITKPITVLQDGVHQIADGNLDYRIDFHAGDEIENLGLSVNRMASDLKEYISNLQSVTAEKERIGAELNVATQIQASMLPSIFPAFPEREEFDIYAFMLPAKEVGGDLYDFFLINEDTLAVVMADVSGKGVPAALFMVIAKTLIKNNAQYGKSPKEVFEDVNNILCENNQAGMFVTAFMGYLDIPSGTFTYVNAGHNPPFLRCGENFDWLKTRPCFVLADMEDMFYKQGEIFMRPGDELFLYTDGVTEAMDSQHKLFSESRLLEVANNYRHSALKVFKLILTSGDSKPVLIDLISASIKRPVTDVVVRNNELPVEDTQEKAERLDVNCKIDDGSQIDLEMQASRIQEDSDGEHKNLKGKSIYYLCDVHSSQPSKGLRRYDLLARTY